MNAVNQEVVDYFESLGYSVDWDKKGGQLWHEILCPKTKKIICQVDFDIPLVAIKEDLICWRQGKSATNDLDYEINGSLEDPLFQEMLQKIE